MATLKNADVRTINDAFVRDGYVLDFSNKTFSEFFEDEMAVDIYANKYGSSKDSKGMRLRAFAEVESPHLVARMMRALWIYMNTSGCI
ncbi:MAG: hypothetical protein ACE37F_28635 [Nannocystaceae bacterium]|nr:hypothetical protein [bacterium]